MIAGPRAVRRGAGGSDRLRRALDLSATHRRAVLGAATALALALAGAGCGREDEPDLVNGKALFAGEGTCGACHTLARAGTRGNQGPNLDAAFGPAREDGLGEETIEGVVLRQIAHPRRNSVMQPDLVEGDDARDVAAYVAMVAGVPGEDQGELAEVGVGGGGETIEASGGTLEIPADPSGALAFVSDTATAPAGQTEITSPNESPIQHNIGIRNGEEVEGPVVGTGGVSRFEFDLEPGEYIFFCSVAGHEEGGMRGTLTVE